MMYISDSDSGCGCRRPLKKHCSQRAMAEPILASGSSSVLIIEPAENTATINADENSSHFIRSGNSSGWPSLLGIASVASLLSSYTPIASRTDIAVSPADDVDENYPPPDYFHRPASMYPASANPRQFSRKMNVVFSRPRKAEPRSRAGPMDIDFDDRDSSWLTSPTAAKTNTPAADPSDGSSTRKRRLITHPTFSDSSSSRTDGPVIGTGSMALGNTPFTFSMPPPPSPANDASAMSQPQATEPMVVDLEQRPISPNAVRRIYSRRRHNNSLRSSITALLGLGQGTRHTGNARGQRGPAADDGSWTTDEEDDGEEPVAATASDHSTTQRTPEHRDGASGRRQRRAQVSRRESNGAATRGVDRVLALMGTRVDEPTMVERLQMHRDIPYVISGYLQLAFNVFMVGTVLTIIINVLMTIQRDVNAKVQEYSAVVMQEIVACSKQYLENKCAPEMRVPAMEKACNMWDTCMNQDPSKVGRAKVSAETLAGIVNGFIEPLSLKTMMFFLLMFFGTLFVSNFAFGAYRHSRVHQQYVNQSSVGESPATGGGSRRNRNRNRSRSRSRSRSQSQSRSGNSGSRADPMSSATHTSQQQYDQPAQSSAASSSNMLVLSNSVRRRPPAQQMFR